MGLPRVLRIVHESRSFVVVDKPAGLLSVPGKGEANQDCVVSRVRAMFERASGPLVVHRLDMDTSGLLIVALTPDTQRTLSMQFEARRVDKQYVAMVHGHVARDQGEVTLPLRPDIDDRPRQVVDFTQGRPATTRYRVLARDADRTRLLMEPVTGRSHQLRVHAAQPTTLTLPSGDVVAGGLGCPIVGDVLYCDVSRHPGDEPRLLLHASELSLLDPDTAHWTTFRAPPGF